MSEHQLKVIPARSFSQLADKMTAEVKKGWVGRHVAWLKEPEGKLGKYFLIGIELFLLSVTLVGIPFIFKGFSASTKLDNYKELKKKGDAIFEAPNFEKVSRSNPKTSLNHKAEFAIHNDLLWHKPLHSKKEEWELLYFDGYLRNEKPVEVSADGANLAVMDNNRLIHFKKIVHEPYLTIFYNKEKAPTITTEDNWERKWFSFPLVRIFYNLFHKNELKIPQDSVAWCMSQRGKWMHHYRDRGGREIPLFMMVTMIGAIIKGKTNCVHYGDPYLWNELNNVIPGPSPTFDIQGYSVSGSTHMVIGLNEKKEVEVWTIDADFDSIGRNPALLSFYFKSFRADENWKKHTLPKISADSNLTTAISIYQTGEGNFAREMTIDVAKDGRIIGFYEKKFSDEGADAWKFVPNT